MKYITKQKLVEARQVDEQSEMVDCYNGVKIATQGDFVVHDEQGRTLVIKKDKFMGRYEEYRQDGDI